MTYKGQEIQGKPTLQMVREFVNAQKYKFNPDDAFVYWGEKNWLTHKGVPPKSLELALVVYNGIFVDRSRRAGEMKVETKLQEPFSTYKDQLLDYRWVAFRNFVLTVRGKSCEKCGKKKNIQIHHPFYRPGAKAWEYSCNEVLVLCSACHKAEHGIKDKNL